MILDGLSAAPTPAQRAAANRQRIIAAQRAAANRQRIIAAQRARLQATQKAAAARQRTINQQRAKLIDANRRLLTAQSAPDEYDPVVTAQPSPVPAETDWSGADLMTTAVEPADALKTDWFWESDEEAPPPTADTDTDAPARAPSSTSAGLWLAAAVAALIYFRPFT